MLDGKQDYVPHVRPGLASRAHTPCHCLKQSHATFQRFQRICRTPPRHAAPRRSVAQHTIAPQLHATADLLRSLCSKQGCRHYMFLTVTFVWQMQYGSLQAMVLSLAGALQPVPLCGRTTEQGLLDIDTQLLSPVQEGLQSPAAAPTGPGGLAAQARLPLPGSCGRTCKRHR
jgi:hypothetical protein